MAQITIGQLRDLVDAAGDWRSRGELPPAEVLELSLSVPGQSSGAEPSIDSSVAGKTLTYEGRSVTVVLDFDDQGYLQSIEFV